MTEIYARKVPSETYIFASSPEGNEMAKVVKVTVNQSNTGQLISSQPATVQTLPVTPSTRLDTLLDVNATAEVEGGVPRYDASTDKYVVEKLDFSDIQGDPGDFEIDEIDGGSF